MHTQRRERRKHYRTTVRTDVSIGQDGVFTRSHAVISELSERGAFIETDPIGGAGTVLSLRFRIPDAEQELSCTAIVRHTRGNLGFGVEFLDMPPDDRERLRQFVKAQVDAYLSEHR